MLALHPNNGELLNVENFNRFIDLFRTYRNDSNSPSFQYDPTRRSPRFIHESVIAGNAMSFAAVVAFPSSCTVHYDDIRGALFSPSYYRHDFVLTWAPAAMADLDRTVDIHTIGELIFNLPHTLVESLFTIRELQRSRDTLYSHTWTAFQSSINFKRRKAPLKFKKAEELLQQLRRLPSLHDDSTVEETCDMLSQFVVIYTALCEVLAPPTTSHFKLARLRRHVMINPLATAEDLS